MPLGAARFGLLGGVLDLGKLELIETLEPNGVNFIDSSTLPTNYNVIKAVWNLTVSSGSANNLMAQFYESGVLETASVYQYAHQYGYLPSTFAEAKSTAIDRVVLGNLGTNSSGGYVYFYNLSDSGKYSFYTMQSVDDNGTMFFGSGVLPQTSVVDKIRFKNTSGAQTFSSGTIFSLYGIAES